MHQSAVGVTFEEIACTSSQVLDFHLTRRKQVNTRNRFVADGDLTLERRHVETGETIESLEQSAVRSAHSQLDLRNFWQDTEESVLVLRQ